MKKTINPILKLSMLLLVISIIFTAGCQEQKSDPSQELKPLIDKYVEIWNNGKVDELDAIMDADYIYHANNLPDVNGIGEMKKVVTAFRTAYPDLRLVVEDELYSENKLSGRWVITGTNTGAGETPPTGKSVRFWGVAILHTENGKLKEEWTAYDNQSLMEQLGYTMNQPGAQEKQR